jgi:hypothetical protein
MADPARGFSDTGVTPDHDFYALSYIFDLPPGGVAGWRRICVM